MKDRNLTFREVSEINRARCERWHPGFPNDGWTGSDWSNAMAGEAGETCNVVKKLRRDDFGKVQAVADSRDELLAKLATEIGDTFMYLDLLAQFYGLDIAQCITDTFNRVSIREGFPERIERRCPGCPDCIPSNDVEPQPTGIHADTDPAQVRMDERATEPLSPLAEVFQREARRWAKHEARIAGNGPFQF